MEDLRLLATEQEFILLESANGEKFRLPLDETLRRALRSEKGPRVEADSISPREIQELVRSGNNVEDIVAKTGASFGYVEKFAVPVLEELEHVISSAQSVRLTFLGERYGESNHIEFGTLIRDRLEQLGAQNTLWRARRNDTGGWQISCEFNLDGSDSAAKWSFDLRHLSLSPENEVALNLAASPKPDTLLPKSKPTVVPATLEEVGVPIDPPALVVEAPVAEPLVGKNLTVSLGDTQEFADVIPFGRGRNTTAQVPVIAAGTSAEIDDEPLDEIDEEGDLLESLRRRRDERESKTGFSPILEVVADSEADFDETTVWIESSDEVFVDEEDINQAEVEEDPNLDDSAALATEPTEESDTQASKVPEPTTPPANSAKKGRATMPSWDEIVFGTKAENKDD